MGEAYLLIHRQKIWMLQWLRMWIIYVFWNIGALKKCYLDTCNTDTHCLNIYWANEWSVIMLFLEHYMFHQSGLAQKMNAKLQNCDFGDWFTLQNNGVTSACAPPPKVFGLKSSPWEHRHLFIVPGRRQDVGREERGTLFLGFQDLWKLFIKDKILINVLIQMEFVVIDLNRNILMFGLCK